MGYTVAFHVDSRESHTRRQDWVECIYGRSPDAHEEGCGDRQELRMGDLKTYYRPCQGNTRNATDFYMFTGINYIKISSISSASRNDADGSSDNNSEKRENNEDSIDRWIIVINNAGRCYARSDEDFTLKEEITQGRRGSW